MFIRGSFFLTVISLFYALSAVAGGAQINPESQSENNPLSYSDGGETSAPPQLVGRYAVNAYYLGLGRVSFDSKEAFAEGVDSDATSIRLAWERTQGAFAFALGMSGFMYSDNEKFSQQVKEQFGGDVSTRSSSADAFSIFGELGYNKNFNEYVHFSVFGGYEQVITSERGIASCTDCYSEDIDIDAGLYVYPRMLFNRDNGFGVSLGYQKYLTGDVEGGFLITFGGGYHF